MDKMRKWQIYYIFTQSFSMFIDKMVHYCFLRSFSRIPVPRSVLGFDFFSFALVCCVKHVLKSKCYYFQSKIMIVWDETCLKCPTSKHKYRILKICQKDYWIDCRNMYTSLIQANLCSFFLNAKIANIEVVT